MIAFAAGCAVGFGILGLLFGWRAARATGPERLRYWSYCGTCSCGMWSEILLLVVMLILR